MRFASRKSAPALVLVMTLYTALAASASDAAEGVRFGVRAGYAELDGSFFNENLEAKDQKLFGIQAVFPFLSDRISLEVAGEGTSDELTFTRSSVGSAFDGEVDWSDLAIYTSVRADLLPVSLLGVYVGAGLGVHFTEIDPDAIADAFKQAGRDLQAEYEGESTELEWHGLLGANFRVGDLIEIFGEGRFRRIEGDFERDGFAGYVGLNLILD